MEKLLKDSKYIVVELADYIEKNKRFGDNVRFVLFLDKLNIMLRGMKIAAMSSEQYILDNYKCELEKLEVEQEKNSIDKSLEILAIKQKIDKSKKDFEVGLKAFNILVGEFDALLDYVHHPQTSQQSNFTSQQSNSTSQTSQQNNSTSQTNQTKQTKSSVYDNSYNKYKKNKLTKKKNKFNSNKMDSNILDDMISLDI